MIFLEIQLLLEQWPDLTVLIHRYHLFREGSRIIDVSQKLGRLRVFVDGWSPN